MRTAKKLDLVSVHDYLAGELIAPVKHEYLGGVVYAMAGARNVYHLIASNTLGTLHARLRGRRCRPFSSDTKIRVRLPAHVRFYYPDVSVICRPNPQTDSFQDESAVIFWTGWEDRWGTPRYANLDAQGRIHQPGMSLEAAQWLVEHLELTGMAALSVESMMPQLASIEGQPFAEVNLANDSATDVVSAISGARLMLAFRIAPLTLPSN